MVFFYLKGWDVLYEDFLSEVLTVDRQQVRGEETLVGTVRLHCLPQDPGSPGATLL